MKALVVLSGGMDSTTALAKVKANAFCQVVGAVNFQYGSKHNDMEWIHAKMVAEFYQVPLQYIRLDFINTLFKSDLLKSGGAIPEGHYADPSMKRTVVPFRNGIMLSIAAGYAESIGADTVVLGNHFGDHAVYPDCRKDFIEPMALAIEKGTYGQIQIHSPFCDVDKTEIARQGHALGVPFHLTYSCYNGQERHCGKCGTCFERKEAFQLAGVPDPTVYQGEV
jgi:7-cyano-7-deazaguanine synthase